MQIKTKKELKEIIRLEKMLWIKRMYPQGAPKRIHSLTPLFMKALRCNEYYANVSKLRGGITAIYWKIVYKVISVLCNVSIPMYCFEKGLLIMHLQNIIISTKVRSGEYTCLFHNVTLGIKLGHSTNGKCPRLGNGVTVCAGAVIVGDVEISSGVTVGANSVVTKSVEGENVVVAGAPAKIVSKNPEWSMLEFSQNVLAKMKE